MRILLCVWASLGLFSTLFATAAADLPLRRVRLHRHFARPVSVAPRIDGALDDVAWREASSMGEFAGLEGGAVSQRTAAFVRYDASHLFVAFRCFESRMAGISGRAQDRDGDIWSDDCVEVFIDTNRDRKTYCQIEINAAGAITDKACVWRDGKVSKDAQWNCAGLQAVVSMGDDAWTVEMAIPFTGLGADLAKSAAWGFNLTRNETPHHELSSWAAVSTTFHSPREFGILSAISRAAVIDQISVGYAGRHTRVVRVGVRNGTREQQLRIRREYQGDSAREPESTPPFSLPAEGAREFEFRYPLPEQNAHDAKIILEEAESGRVLGEYEDHVPKHYFQVRDEFVTPHTPWAKPLSGGPLRVLFITPYFSQRDLVELGQRISLDTRTVSFIANRWSLPERPSPETYLELLRRELAGELDAIVIDRPFVQASSRHGSERFSGVSLPADILATVAHRVAAGTGLLLFTHGDVPPQWDAIGLKSCSKPAMKPCGLSLSTTHYTTTGVPLAAFSHLRLPVYTTSNSPLLHGGRSVFMSTTESGLRRVLVLGHSPNGMVPADPTGRDYSHCDNYFAFLARCLVWLSRREGEIRLEEWSVRPATIQRLGATPVTVAAGLRTTGPATDLQLWVRVRAADGRVQAEQRTAMTVAANGFAKHEFTFSNGLSSGRYFADLIVRSGEGVVEWGTTAFDVHTPVRIASVSPNETVLPAGRAISGTVELEGGRSAATAVHSAGLPEATTAGQVAFVDGHKGSALLPGAGALVYAAEGNLNVSAGSVEMWVALGDPRPGDSGTTTNWWWRTPHALRVLHYPDRGQVSFQVRPVADAGTKSASISFSVSDWADGEWHHAVWTWDKPGLKVYIDGRLAGKSKPLPMPTVLQGPLRIAHCPKYAPTSAMIDEFRVYGRTLSPEEVAARAVPASEALENDLLLHLPFDVSDAPPAGLCRLHVALHDRRDRVVSETWIDVGAGETRGIPFRFRYDAPVARSAQVVARLLDKDGVIDEVHSPWVELAENGLDDFLYFCWDWAYSRRHPDYMRDTFFRRIWEQGVDGTDGSASLDFKLVAGAPFPGGKRNSVDGRPWYDVFNELKANYARTGDSKHLIRQPCLSDPATWADYREKVARKVLPMRSHKPVAYGLGDENTITFESSPLDFCFSPHCLREFRAWLKGEYGSLDQLNSTWKTTFAGWDDVVPMTTAQVATHGSFAPWADHRAFMETVFAKAYERAAAAVHAIDPDARLSTSGTRPSYPYSACDWWQILPHLDHLMPYPRLYDQGEVQRSFARLPTMACSGFGATGAYQKYMIWYAALHGSSAVIFSKVTTCVSADLSVYPDQPLRTAEMRDLQNGLGKALMSARRLHDGVAIHYSPASIRAEWITSFASGRRTGYESALARDRRAWLRTLEALGLQYEFISGEQISGDALIHGGWKVLVMPYSQAVSDSEARAIERFVKRGGTLVGTYRTGAFDSHCATRPAGALDAVFGISRRDAAPSYDDIEVTDVGEGRARMIRNLTSGPGLVVNSAEAIAYKVGRDKREPAVCRARLGGGTAYYLDFLYDFKASYKAPGAQVLDPAFIALVQEIMTQAGVTARARLDAPPGTTQAEVVRYRQDQAEYVCVLRQWQLPDGAEEMLETEILFGRHTWVCDVRTGKRLRFGDRAPVRLGPGECQVYGLLDYDVSQIRVTTVGPQQILAGGVLRLELAVLANPPGVGRQIPGWPPPKRTPRDRTPASEAIDLASLTRKPHWRAAACRAVAPERRLVPSRSRTHAGPSRTTALQKDRLRLGDKTTTPSAGEHVLHLEFIGPNGVSRRHYAANLVAAEGHAEKELRFACNDPVGLWRVIVRDVVSGVTAELPVELIAGTPPKRPDIRMRSAWDVTGVVEELRNSGVTIPRRIEQLVDKVCREINLQRVHDSGEQRDDVQEIIELLAELPIPGDCPARYLARRDLLDALSVKAPELPVLSTTGYLQDRVLGVGLKSYPYVIDWDGDGLRDLVVGDHDGLLYLYMNESTAGDPEFGRGVRIPSAGNGEDLILHFNPKLDFADLAGDGKLDLVLGSHAGKVLLLANLAEGENGFAFDASQHAELATRQGVIDIGNYAYPELVDWDGDGCLDLLVGEEEGGLYLLKGKPGKSAPRFLSARPVEGVLGSMYPCPEVVDWDSDGRFDILLGDRDGTLRLFMNSGDLGRPMFSGGRQLRNVFGELLDVGRLSHPHMADWNGDGAKDLIVGNDDGDVLVWRNIANDSAPSFDDAERLRDGGGELVCGVHPVVDIVDWNGDGKLDILAGGETERVRLYLNTGAAKDSEFDSFSFLPGVVCTAEALCPPDAPEQRLWANSGLEFTTEYVGNLAPEAVDWNEDGNMDLLLGNYTGLVYLYPGEKGRKLGPGKPLRTEDGALLRVAGFSTPRVTDWNDDGRKDLVCGNFLGRVHVFLNVGTDAAPRLGLGERLQVAGEEFAFGPRVMVEVADWNGDGKKDVLLGNRLGKLVALINCGSAAEPRFDRLEFLRDDSDVWRELYGGAWASPRAAAMPLYKRREGGVGVLDVVATACPRVVDWDADGERELLISHRFGRIFVFEPKAAD